MAKKEPVSTAGKQVITRFKSCQRERLKSKNTKSNDTVRSRISKKQKQRLMEKTRRQCHVCGRRIVHAANCDIDHVKQRVHGGKDVEDNYLAACKRCNYLRGKLHYSEIQEAIALGKWAMLEIQKGSRKGIELANLYGDAWVKNADKSK